jgi:Flp pilus assembly protein TadD
MGLAVRRQRASAQPGGLRPRPGLPRPDVEPTPLRDAVDVEALLLLGIAVAARGQTARAAAILDRVARERPEEAHPCSDLAGLLPRLSHGQVTAQYRASLRLAPEDMRLRHAFAGFLQARGNVEEAVAVLREGLRQNPGSSAAQHAMGVALAELGHIADATWHLEQAVSIAPWLAAAWANLGMLLKVEKRFPSAFAAYEQAITHAPDDVQIRVNRAVALLHAGHWAEAWPDYDWRLRLPGPSRLPPERLLPSLSEAGDLMGMTVLVTHEEGIGDTLQFLRYLPQLARLGARVLLWVPSPLVRLAETLPGVAGVFSGDGDLPAYDWHCPCLSLPRVFRTTVATVAGEPYLDADPALAETWTVRLPPSGFRVGLAWAGQARPWQPGFATLDRRRSAGLAAFAPLAAVPGVCFVSLQKGPAAVQARTPPDGMMLYDPMDAVEDFADTAAIIANLDVVVSVDTAVAHLSGAMGKTVFLLDRYDNCWRWLTGRADSPWYRSMTIFRQERLGDWAAPMARAAAALEVLATFHGAGAAAPPDALASFRM